MVKSKDEVIESLKNRIYELENQISHIENSVRDEYLHSKEWVKHALEKLVYFAAIELQPASLDVSNHKIVSFLGDDFFGYSYNGFFTFNQRSGKWEVLAQQGECTVDISSMPEFKGSMVMEEDREIYHFFDIAKNSYLIHVSLVGKGKKFSEHDFSFISLFVVLATSFYSMKVLDKEVQDKMIENSNMRSAARIVNGLKDNTITLEDAFIELIQNLNIDEFVIARKSMENGDLKIVLSDGTDARNWDSFLKTVYEDEDYASDEWLLLPMFDDMLTVYGASVFKLSHNLSIRSVQERVLESVIPQFTETLSNKKLHKDSITDELTGAFNRRYIMKILDDRFNRCLSNPEAKLSVAMIDIDNFKSVNDTYGHLAGDAVLKKVVEAFNKTLREVDIIGRYGGEEFLIIISTKSHVAAKVCERIREAVESMRIEWNGKDLWVTISIGFVSASPEILTVEEMVALSDLCLYEAKKTGKNRVVEYKGARGEF
ncbi:GGDEF domain-containing protein [bacterium]|jgi:diguanylate cyclase (GGDEF)-like protein|nr:GGDEF domain-containing protein [bacterium]